MLPVGPIENFFSEKYYQFQIKANFFMPRELLNGLNLCSFNIISPQLILDHLKKPDKHFEHSLIYEVVRDNQHLFHYLESVGLFMERNSIYHDIEMLTPICRCLELAQGSKMQYKSSAKVMINRVLTTAVTDYSYALMMKTLYYVIYNHDDLSVFKAFITDTKEDDTIDVDKKCDHNSNLPPKMA